jgi:hypothetical protein
MALSTTTRDHDEIRRWAEARGAQPAEVASTHTDGDAGILRFCFPNAPNRNDKSLREISWDEFFEKFDENNLELVYQEKTAAGQASNFNKLVHPSSEEHSGRSGSHGKQAASRSHATASSASSTQKHSAKSSGKSAAHGKSAASKSRSGHPSSSRGSRAA